MGLYDFIGYTIGFGFVLFLLFFFIVPFFIVIALLNDKTYHNVKAQIDNPANPWESITKMK
jgi:pilus assembly protein TadC